MERLYGRSLVRGRFAVLLSGLLAAGTGGCAQLIGGKTVVPETRKFIVEAETIRLSLPHSERPYPYRVAIEKFAVSRVYDKNQIVFRLSPHEMREDRYHRWAVRPSEMITDAVEAYLNMNPALFIDISQQFLDVEPDFSLRGTVKAIERFDSGDVWIARLAMSMQLVDRNNRVVWHVEFDDEQQVYLEDFSHTVETIRKILRTRMERYIRELDRHFLIQKLQSEKRPYEFLLDEEVMEELEAAPADSADAAPTSNPDYEIVPGKLAPE